MQQKNLRFALRTPCKARLSGAFNLIRGGLLHRCGKQFPPSIDTANRAAVSKAALCFRHWRRFAAFPSSSPCIMVFAMHRFRFFDKLRVGGESHPPFSYILPRNINQLLAATVQFLFGLHIFVWCVKIPIQCFQQSGRLPRPLRGARQHTTRKTESRLNQFTPIPPWREVYL